MAINLDHVTEQITVTDEAANADLTLVAKGTGGVINNVNGNSLTVTRNTGTNIMKVTAANTQNLALQATGGGSVYLKTGDDTSTQFVAAFTASAVNYLNVTGGATGSGPAISAQGSDADINLSLSTKANGSIFLNAGGTNRVQVDPFGGVNLAVSFSGGVAFKALAVGNQVNFLQAAGATTGFQPILSVQGTDANVGPVITSKGSGSIDFYTQNVGARQFSIANTASAVNYWQLTGSVTAGQPTISAQGSDASIGLNYRTKGSWNHAFQNGSGNNGFIVEPVGTANYLQATSANTANAPILKALGTDTNINLNLVPKGTGNVQQNGVNLALSTHKYHAFSVGTYYFDTYEQSNYFRLFTQNATSDTVRYKTVSSPQYYDYGTSTWTAWPAGQSGIENLLDGNQATGINVAHANRTFRFVVSGVDGWPTNALVLLQTTWSAIAYTTATVTIASSTVIGGPFTSRQVMVFSGANTGNNWGMHSYFTGSIHTGDTFYQITIDLTDWVDVSTYTTYPLRNFSIFSNYSTTGGMVPYNTTYGKNASFIGGITTGTDVNGGLGIGRYSSSDTNAYLDAIGSASGMFQRVNYWPVTRLAYTASSVNYLQFAGSITGFGPLLSAQGSDTNIPLVLQPKGTGALQAQQTDSTATGGNARGANAVDFQTSRTTAAQIAFGQYSVVVGGTSNAANAQSTVVVGGQGNNASGTVSSIVGGLSNTSGGYASSIVGGWANVSAGYFNFIGNGYSNAGTANAAVTTQSATMNGTTAVTLSGSNASIKVGQLVTGTSVQFFPPTYVAAISGTSLTLSQAASGSSTSTLSFFTPHGVVVGGGNNQATGSYSFIGGGGDAGQAFNRNVASGDWSFVGGGRTNIASGHASVVVGGGSDGSSSSLGSVASGVASFIGGGLGSAASGTGSSVLGGYQHIANGQLSSILGGRYGNTRSIAANFVFPTNAIVDGSGVSQAALIVLGRQTTDATPTVLASNAGAAGTTNQVILPNNSAYYFRGEVVSGVTGGGNTKGWYIEGVIKRGANAASTALVGTPTVTSNYADAGASTWTIAVTADTTNGGLAVTFTGQAGTTIRTVAQIRTTEMTF